MAAVNALVDTLQSKGVIGSSLAFRIWSWFHGVPAVAPGAYAFNQNMSFGAVDQVISAGPQRLPPRWCPPASPCPRWPSGSASCPVTTQPRSPHWPPAGRVRSPWQPAGSNNLDGLLGVGTYVVVPGETDRQLLTKMVDRFDTEADGLGLAAGSAALGLTPYQVITVASIVEKEGVIAKEPGSGGPGRSQPAGTTDMPLQMDSTVLYAEGRDGGTVTATDLQLPSPYNTYLNKGLTPTPICFPSVAALRAALDPPAGSWLYFVVVEPDGTEAFADTFAEQPANEALAKQRGLP